ncbi:MAG: hypothetical protein CUN54_08350 [Phototrophicales bacterium]|nr:MAG: hypothetical protein CUN54_08350 [Phototrophicales bacterium]
MRIHVTGWHAAEIMLDKLNIDTALVEYRGGWRLWQDGTWQTPQSAQTDVPTYTYNELLALAENENHAA